MARLIPNAVRMGGSDNTGEKCPRAPPAESTSGAAIPRARMSPTPSATPPIPPRAIASITNWVRTVWSEAPTALRVPIPGFGRSPRPT